MYRVLAGNILGRLLARGADLTTFVDQCVDGEH